MESRCWREIWLVSESAMVLKLWREPRARRLAQSLTIFWTSSTEWGAYILSA